VAFKLAVLVYKALNNRAPEYSYTSLSSREVTGPGPGVGVLTKKTFPGALGKQITLVIVTSFAPQLTSQVVVPLPLITGGIV